MLPPAQMLVMVLALASSYSSLFPRQTAGRRHFWVGSCVTFNSRQIQFMVSRGSLWWWCGGERFGEEQPPTMFYVVIIRDGRS